MTYLLSKQRQSLTAGINIYKDASVSSIADDQPISWSQTLHSLGSSYNFTLTFDGTTFTIPNDSNVYVFEGMPVWYSSTNSVAGYKFAWYNTTTSQWVGTWGHITGGLNSAEGRTGGLVADERAIYVTDSSHNLQLRLKSSSSNYSNLTNVDFTGAASLEPFFNRARVIVTKYS